MSTQQAFSSIYITTRLAFRSMASLTLVYVPLGEELGVILHPFRVLWRHASSRRGTRNSGLA